LDAAECPPTFRTPPGLIQGLIAGGPDAVFRAKEGAEDSAPDGEKALSEAGVRAGDLVIGLAASGRTPWVVGALKEARTLGAATVGIDCTPQSELSDLCDLSISVHVGPEVITGSTRMKAATAQKLILNMISTTAMIGLGKVYGNLMVDLQPWSEKLRSRAKKIIMLTTGLPQTKSEKLLEDAGYNVKVALVMARTGQSRGMSEELLRKADGFVRKAIELGAGRP
jgi:N-acetylmuramic acid 6-phosphate etherase